jgi:DHA1 family multidrug resistance protein-like MFS transporter
VPEINWKRNVAVLCTTQLLTLIGFSSYFPIIPFYMMELGAETYEQALSLNAAFSSTAAITMMIASPIWGTLADRYGRKMMVVRATMGGAILSFLMGLAQTPEHLILLRALQGALSGTMAAAMTLISTQTPEKHLGVSLGMMQTVQYAGLAIGPLIGGVTSDLFGYRTVFPVSAGLQTISLILAVTLVKERFVRIPTVKGPRRTPRELLEAFAGVTAVLLFVVGLIRLTTTTVSPIMSLYVNEIDPGNPRVGTLAGTVSSASAVTSAVAAFLVGRAGDRIGQRKVLLICIVGMAALYIPLAYVKTVTQLIMFYAALGLFLGGTMPTANALLARSTPTERRGAVFGISNSFQAAGRSLGPMIGAGIANRWGISSVFLATSGFCAVIAVVIVSVLNKIANGAARVGVVQRSGEAIEEH